MCLERLGEQETYEERETGLEGKGGVMECGRNVLSRQKLWL